MTRILLFGDSSTYGSWGELGGYADRVKQYCHKQVLDSHTFCLAYNLGISGDTSFDLLERMEYEARMRMKEDEDNILIISIGTNDSQLLDDTTPKVTINDFKENLSEIFQIAWKYTNKVIFVSTFPVNEEKTSPYLENHFFRNKSLQEYNNAALQVCKLYHVIHLEFMSWLKPLGWDGLHPSTAQHKQVFEKIKEVLDKWL